MVGFVRAKRKVKAEKERKKKKEKWEVFSQLSQVCGEVEADTL